MTPPSAPTIGESSGFESVFRENLLDRVALDIGVWDNAVEPSGKVPRRVAEETHDCGNKSHPDDERVDEDTYPECEGERLDGAAAENGGVRIGQSYLDLADHIEEAHKALEDELASFVEWTVGIEAGGVVLGLLSAGIGEGAAQAAEAGRIAKLAARVKAVLDTLSVSAKALSGGLEPALATGVSAGLRPILDRIPLIAESRAAAGGARVAESAAGAIKVTGRKFGSVKDFKDWASGLQQRAANFGSKEAREYQIRVTGSDKEFKLVTADGKTKVWADGVRYDPEKDAAVIEAKFVDKPGESLYQGEAPEFMAEKILGGKRGFDEEMARYARVISDPTTPVSSLDLVVSTKKAKSISGRESKG